MAFRKDRRSKALTFEHSSETTVVSKMLKLSHNSDIVSDIEARVEQQCASMRQQGTASRADVAEVKASVNPLTEKLKDSVKTNVVPSMHRKANALLDAFIEQIIMEHLLHEPKQIPVADAQDTQIQNQKAATSTQFSPTPASAPTPSGRTAIPFSVRSAFHAPDKSQASAVKSSAHNSQANHSTYVPQLGPFSKRTLKEEEKISGPSPGTTQATETPALSKDKSVVHSQSAPSTQRGPGKLESRVAETSSLLRRTKLSVVWPPPDDGTSATIRQDTQNSNSFTIEREQNNFFQGPETSPVAPVPSPRKSQIASQQARVTDPPEASDNQPSKPSEVTPVRTKTLVWPPRKGSEDEYSFPYTEPSHDVPDTTTYPIEILNTVQNADEKGSPWRVSVITAANVSAAGSGLQLVPINRPTRFDIRTGNSAYNGDVQVTITSPSRRPVPSSLNNVGNGNFSVEYAPTEVGNYLIEVSYEGLAIPGSPYTSKAYDASAIVVSSIPNGLVNKPVEFTVDVTQAGEGQLEIMVNRGSVPNSVKMIRKGVFQVSFVPKDTNPHSVDVKFNGELLPYSPMSVPIMDASRITVQGEGLRQVAVNRQSFFRVNTQSAGVADLAVRVTSPNGELVPAKILQQPDGDYKVEYSSRFTGRHTVEILYAGQAIMGSPFYVEIYDPNKIRVEGTRSGIVGQRMDFDIINDEAGRAELGLTITSPSGRNVPYDINPVSSGDHVSYVPMEPGSHQIFITYGGLNVPGTPIQQNVMDAGGAGAYGDGLKFAHEDKPSQFYVDTQGRKGNLDVQVDGPNSIAKVNIEPDASGKYLVTYVPVEVGIYNVNVRWNGRPIEGSPFRPRVVDSRKVRPVGGWEAILDHQERMHLKSNQRNRIEFDTSNAGPGEMRAEVKGPDGQIPVDVAGGNGRYNVSFVPRLFGDYYIKIFWGDMCLSRCPICGVASSDVPKINHDKVILTGHGLMEARVREEAEFVIDGSEAGSGVPDVKLTGVKSDIDVRCVPLGGHKYKCVYVPQIPGAYLLSIMWSDRQVRGSPFKVNVLSSSDASKVTVSGEGIHTGVFGKEIKAVIDTRKAGPGELTAHCMGPQKVAYCELYDHRDGTFTLNIKPQEAGKHILQVKYGGEHVPGSPFVLRVAGAPDASKVRVSGPGVEHGLLAAYQSRFIVETRGAGAGQLTVRIRGPKGAFRVEMSRESQKDRTILCRYDPTEVGDYIISVKWSNEHVPGSPFHVQIFDARDELERFLSENPHRRQNAPAMPDRRWSEDL